MKFKSKVDLWYYLTVLTFALSCVMMVSFSLQSDAVLLKVLSVIFILIFLIWILPIAFYSFCVLEEDTLFIRCGLCFKRIRYQDILYVEKTRDPSSSLAPSVDRLGIEFRTGRGKDYVMIAPKEKQKFVEEIRKKNPFIFYKPGA
ncbi:MAG TPA: PH domain-containing protein [Caproicibacter sp.]|nr:PH domain-containing protein [Caproicibacter sp.]